MPKPVQKKLRVISIAIFSIFYGIAGLNHFINPTFYLPLIPDWLPYHGGINVISGLTEIVIGILIWYTPLRKTISLVTILMLVAFIPAHVHFIVEGSCVGELCVHPAIGWLRLLIIHPILIYWAWSIRKS